MTFRAELSMFVCYNLREARAGGNAFDIADSAPTLATQAPTRIEILSQHTVHRLVKGGRRTYSCGPSCYAIALSLLILGQIAGLLLMTETPARAYVDPGTGLFFFQMLGASLAGGFFFMRHKLRRLFRRDADEVPPHQSSAATPTGQPADLTSAPPSRPPES